MSHNLEEQLISESYDYNFFQSVHLIESYLVKQGSSNSFRSSMRNRELIQFKTDNSISFPGNDVVSVEKDPKSGGYTLSLSFMGLYGVSSPLPSYFTEPLNRGREEFAPLRKFLDIFSHRVYSLFYQSWKKYRYQIQYNPKRPDDYSKALYTLIGRTAQTTHAPESPAYRKEMARLSLSKQVFQRVRSSANLKRTLQHYFAFPKVAVRQFAPKEINNPAPCTIGHSRAILGGSVLGSKIIDRTGAFQVDIGPLSHTQFQRFLPDSTGELGVLRGEVKKLVEDFLDAPLEYGITVALDHTDTECMKEETTLGSGALGWNTWLGLPNEEITLNL
ncbi:MAG: type VI secretion system baseplate subunit TssG [Fibrobacterales bacterium]